MTMFYPDTDQQAQLQREIAQTRQIQIDENARNNGDAAAYAHGRADELTRILLQLDDPDNALHRAESDLHTTTGRGKNYVLGERAAAQLVRTLATTGRPATTTCTLARNSSMRALIHGDTEVEVLDFTHGARGIDSALIKEVKSRKTRWVRGHALARLTVTAQ